MPAKERFLSLSGRKILISAGPTREHLDPVRFISNPSSGRMGYALARSCRDRGALVTLVSGPVELAPPRGIHMVPVISAREMLAACRKAFSEADVFIACAAVSDFRPARTARQKRKKDGNEEWLLLKPNPDILFTLSRNKGKRVLVGFAAETQDLVRNAQAKLARKRLDMIVANSVSGGRGFGAKSNQAQLLLPGRPPEELPLMSKEKLAAIIVAKVARLSAERGRGGI